jgi:predicted HicB family RNase H-like nuclease
MTELAERLKVSADKVKPPLTPQKVLYIRSDKLHGRVRAIARKVGISVNEFCEAALETTLDEIDKHPDAFFEAAMAE